MKQVVLHENELIRLQIAVKSMLDKLVAGRDEVEIQLYNSLLNKLSAEDYITEEAFYSKNTVHFFDDEEEDDFGYDRDKKPTLWDDEFEEDFDEEYDNRFNK